MPSTSLCQFARVGLLLVAALTARAQTDDAAVLRDRVLRRPFNAAVLGDVERSGDPSLLPVLRQAFDDVQDKLDKQGLAKTLIHLGDRSDKYFDYLAGFAIRAVESNAPNIFMYDAEGRVMRGAVSPEFETWCRRNQRDLKQEAANQISVYSSDLFELAAAKDPRSLRIFKRGLTSASSIVVGMCASGLIQLQDLASIPDIVAAADRFPLNDLGAAIARLLSEYDGKEAEDLIRASLRDPKLTGMYTAALKRKQERQFRGKQSNTK